MDAREKLDDCDMEEEQNNENRSLRKRHTINTSRDYHTQDEKDQVVQKKRSCKKKKGKPYLSKRKIVALPRQILSRINSKKKKVDYQYRLDSSLYVAHQGWWYNNATHKNMEHSYRSVEDGRSHLIVTPIQGNSDSFEHLEEITTIKHLRPVLTEPRTVHEYRQKEYSEKDVQNIAKCKKDKKKAPPNGGTTCHQCRQYTLDTKSFCHNSYCIGIHGQVCGPCLRIRYGECVEAALKDTEWICPYCRGICNCSFCRRRNGLQPTGILSHVAIKRGYKSVHHLLNSIENKHKKDKADKNSSKLEVKNDSNTGLSVELERFEDFAAARIQKAVEKKALKEPAKEVGFKGWENFPSVKIVEQNLPQEFGDSFDLSKDYNSAEVEFRSFLERSENDSGGNVAATKQNATYCDFSMNNCARDENKSDEFFAGFKEWVKFTLNKLKKQIDNDPSCLESAKRVESYADVNHEEKENVDLSIGLDNWQSFGLTTGRAQTEEIHEETEEDENDPLENRGQNCKLM